MKHCYNQDCKVISTDEYRTKYQCTICEQFLYQLKDRTTKVEGTDSTSLVGSILLVDGTPHITCGWCNQVSRLHQAKKIRIFIEWEEVDPEYVWVVVGTNKVRAIKKKFRPKMRTPLGCEQCVNFQDSESRKLGRLHCYGLESMPVSTESLKPDTTKYAPKVEVTPIPYRFETSGRTKVQRWGVSREEEDVPVEKELKKGLYGPYQDRRGK